MIANSSVTFKEEFESSRSSVSHDNHENPGDHMIADNPGTRLMTTIMEPVFTNLCSAAENHGNAKEHGKGDFLGVTTSASNSVCMKTEPYNFSCSCQPGDYKDELMTDYSPALFSDKPLVKLWSGDRSKKKLVKVHSYDDALNAAFEKGICTSKDAKRCKLGGFWFIRRQSEIYLEDGTEVERDTFSSLLRCTTSQCIFIVTDEWTDFQDHRRLSGVNRNPYAPVEHQPHTSTSSKWFHLPLEALSASTAAALSNGSRLDTRDRRELVRIVVSVLTRDGAKPGRKKIREVAEFLVRKYPGSLQDRTITGSLVGDGYSTFSQQLENRVENVCRGRRSAVEEFTGCKLPTGQVKAACGSGDLRPPVIGITKERVEELQRWMQLEVQKPAGLIDLATASLAMQDTYFAQRLYINSEQPAHSTAEIRDAWPMLFRRNFFLAHAQRLIQNDTNKDFSVSFHDGMSDYANKVIEALKDSAKPRIQRWLALLEITQRRARNEEVGGLEEAILLPLIINYFDEDELFILHQFEEGCSINENLNKLPCTPVVVLQGEDVFCKNKFSVLMDHVVIFERVRTFVEAAMLMFAAYFVLNIQYPPNVGTTLEFIERYIMNIGQQQGTKQKKRPKTKRATRKHLNLMQLLSK